MDAVSAVALDVRSFHALPFAYRLAAQAHLALLADPEGSQAYHEDDIVNVSRILQDAYQHRDWPILMDFQRSLQSLLDLRGHWTLAVQLNLWACEAAEATGNRLDWSAWTHHRGDLHNQQGRYPPALAAYEASEQAYLALDREPQALKSRHQRAMVLRATGRYRASRQLCEATIARAEVLGLHGWAANPLYLRALLARDRGSYRLAEATIRDSLQRFQAAGNQSLAAHCLHFYGELLLLEGRDISRARGMLLESLEASRSLGIVRRVAATQRLLGDLERHAGRLALAERYNRQAIETCEAIGDRPQKARAMFSQALLAYATGDAHTGRQLLSGVADFYVAIGDPRGAAGACLLLALHSLRRLDLRRALGYGWRGLGIAWQSGLFAPQFLAGVLRRWSRF